MQIKKKLTKEIKSLPWWSNMEREALFGSKCSSTIYNRQFSANKNLAKNPRIQFLRLLRAQRKSSFFHETTFDVHHIGSAWPRSTITGTKITILFVRGANQIIPIEPYLSDNVPLDKINELQVLKDRYSTFQDLASKNHQGEKQTNVSLDWRPCAHDLMVLMLVNM